MLLFRVVPLLSIDEIEEIQELEGIENGDIATTAATAGRQQTPQIPQSEPTSDESRLVGATGKAHRVAGATGVLMLVALLGMFGLSSAEPASAAPGATTPVAPTVSITGAEVGGLMVLSAKLTGPDGNPLPDAKVTLLLSTTQFGAQGRLVSLGAVNTDKTGLAQLTLGGDVDHLYKPTTNGPQEFVATYAAAGEPEVTSSTTVNVTAGKSAYHPAPHKPLADVGRVLAFVLFAIVGSIWLTLGAQVWRVRRVCRRAQVGTAL
jgi:hypothetical protein